jgi:hypothetical protein
MAKNKAEMIGQVFIFILAGLIFVLIISYGYKAVSYFLERQQEVVMVDIKTDLDTAVEGIKRSQGSIRKLVLKLPGEYKAICFFDYETCNGLTDANLPEPNQDTKVLWGIEACKAGSENVFTVPRTPGLSMTEISVDGGYVCVPNNNGVTLKLEGTGRKAKISAWQ